VALAFLVWGPLSLTLFISIPPDVTSTPVDLELLVPPKRRHFKPLLDLSLSFSEIQAQEGF